MLDPRHLLGQAGERLAVAYLEEHGYRIRGRNLRLPPWGEVDIVAERDDVIALVEVRLRRGDRYGAAAESLSPTKQRRMLRAAARYAQLLGSENQTVRIDFIAVSLDARGALRSIEHFENAVEGEGYG